jgi:hypothetical protein
MHTWRNRRGRPRVGFPLSFGSDAPHRQNDRFSISRRRAEGSFRRRGNYTILFGRRQPLGEVSPPFVAGGQTPRPCGADGDLRVPRRNPAPGPPGMRPICRRRANAPPLRGGRGFAALPQESGPHFSLSCQRKVAAGAVEKKTLYVPISAVGLIGGCGTGALARYKFDGTMTLPEISLGEMQSQVIQGCPVLLFPLALPRRVERPAGGYRIRPYVLYPPSFVPWGSAL